jgi:integrase
LSQQVSFAQNLRLCFAGWQGNGLAYSMSTSSGSWRPDRPLGRFLPNPKLRFLDQCREVLRFKQMAPRTEESYVDWIRRFIVWSGKRHPREMGAAEVRGFLTHLAVERNVAAATQNQALNALVFLYREVVGGELEWLEGFEPAKRGQRLPEVLSRQEVHVVLEHLRGTHAIIARLLYGTGMRLLEGLRLRVKDVDFRRGQLVVRAGSRKRLRLTRFSVRDYEPCSMFTFSSLSPMMVFISATPLICDSD